MPCEKNHLTGIVDGDLLPTILSFLGPKDRAICSFVSTHWQSICHQQGEQDIHDWITTNVVPKYERRREQRERNRLKKLALDETSAAAAAAAERKNQHDLEKSIYWALVRSKEEKIQEMVDLLDQGVQALSLSHEIRQAKEGEYVDEVVPQHFDNPAFDIVGKDLRILTENIASPSPAWRHWPIESSRWLLRYTQFGQCECVSKYNCSKPPASFERRWETWKVFRSMVYMAQHYGEAQQDYDGYEFTLHDFWQSCKETRYAYRRLGSWLNRPSSMDFYFARLFHDVVLPLAPPNLSFVPVLLKEHPFAWKSKLYPYHVIFCALVFDCEDAYWVDIFRYFWETKERQKMLYRYMVNSRCLRVLVIERHLRMFCKRKDHKVLELLFQLEPLAMIASIPSILTHLQMARGKKERLVEYFTAIHKTHRTKVALLEQVRTISPPI